MKALKTRFFVPAVFALGLLIGLAAMGTAWAAQTHMQNALSDLQNAQYQLQQATPDKGGHRVNALNYVEKAIQETRWGIQYAK